MNHRLFFSLEPGNRERREIQAVQNKLDVRGRAVNPAQFHATLAFLGTQSAEMISTLCAIAENLPLEPCTVVLDRVGSFPRAGVLWLDASDIPAVLREFQHRLVESIQKAGIECDRRTWKMHVTLYRHLRKPFPIMAVVPVIWPLTGFSLMESVSVKNGVEYQCQGNWKTRI